MHRIQYFCKCTFVGLELCFVGLMLLLFVLFFLENNNKTKDKIIIIKNESYVIKHLIEMIRTLYINLGYLRFDAC